jgi:predicted dehydrogenase
MEIYGREGTLVATGEDSPQLGEVLLHGAKRDDKLASLPVPERLRLAAPGTPSGEAGNVGQMYALFAQSIRDGKGRQPTFETAVELHHLIDAIRQAAESGREIASG